MRTIIEKVEGRILTNRENQLINLTRLNRVEEDNWLNTGIVKQAIKGPDGKWDFVLEPNTPHWMYFGRLRGSGLFEVSSEVVLGKHADLVFSVKTLRNGVMVTSGPDMDDIVKGFLVMTTEERRTGTSKRRSTIY
jgi:hypothetical protein